VVVVGGAVVVVVGGAVVVVGGGAVVVVVRIEASPSLRAASTDASSRRCATSEVSDASAAT
jgi:hypothetical protein